MQLRLEIFFYPRVQLLLLSFLLLGRDLWLNLVLVFNLVLLLRVGWLEIPLKVDIRVGSKVMGLDELQCNELLGALVAFEEVAFLLSRQFEKKFVSTKGFLFYFDVLLQCTVFIPLLLNGFINFHCI